MLQKKYFLKNMKSRTLLSIIAIVLLSIYSIRSLFITGFFPMHDDTQVARVFEMKKSLSDGLFPVRWVEDLGYGYGYPIFNFYAPLAYYTGVTIDLVVNDSLLATKIMVAVGLLAAGIFMYVLAKEFWGELGGVLSALLYIYAPYHALNVYVRGAIAETFGYAFIPLAFYGLYKSYLTKEWKYVIIGSLGFAGIITSHNLTAMMTTPFIIGLVVLFAIRKKSMKSLLAPILVLIIGLLLSAFYWLPSLAEMGYTNVSSQVGGGADYKNHFVCLPQLWDSTWGFGGSVPGCIDGMSYRIGKIHIILTLFVIIGSFFIKKNTTQKTSVLFASAILLTCIFLMTEYSKLLWDIISPMEYFQYPWRFLVLASAVTSFIAGAMFWILKENTIYKGNKRMGFVLLGVLSFITIFFYAKLFTPQTILPATNEKLTDKHYINWTVSKISDEYMPKGFVTPESQSQIPKEAMYISGTNVEIKEKKVQRISGRVLAFEDTMLHANIAYFPAWKAWVNDKEVQITKGSTGMEIPIKKGVNIVVFEFIQTPIEKLSNILSLSGFSILIVGIIMTRKRNFLK
jgi:hypothetical protein